MSICCISLGCSAWLICISFLSIIVIFPIFTLSLLILLVPAYLVSTKLPYSQLMLPECFWSENCTTACLCLVMKLHWLHNLYLFCSVWNFFCCKMLKLLQYNIKDHLRNSYLSTGQETAKLNHILDFLSSCILCINKFSSLTNSNIKQFKTILGLMPIMM